MSGLPQKVPGRYQCAENCKSCHLTQTRSRRSLTGVFWHALKLSNISSRRAVWLWMPEMKSLMNIGNNFR